jgi:hypothetical protein
MRDGARQPIFTLMRRPEHAFELLGDGVEKKGRGVVAIPKQRPRQAVVEFALAEPEESIHERRRQSVGV